MKIENTNIQVMRNKLHQVVQNYHLYTKNEYKFSEKISLTYSIFWFLPKAVKKVIELNTLVTIQQHTGQNMYPGR